MSWSDNLKAYLGDAKIDSAFLYTIDGSQRFAETGAAEAITAKEVSDAVKAVASDTKFQGVTIGGTKYVYLLENTGVFAFKKKTKACLFFHGAAYACFIMAEIEPRVLMGAGVDLRTSLSSAGLN